jgi:hypothetical protein
LPGEAAQTCNAFSVNPDGRLETESNSRGAGAGNHYLGENARATQMFGVGRIKPFVRGAYQQAAVWRTLGAQFGFNDEAARDPWR